MHCCYRRNGRRRLHDELADESLRDDPFAFHFGRTNAHVPLTHIVLGRAPLVFGNVVAATRIVVRLSLIRKEEKVREEEERVLYWATRLTAMGGGRRGDLLELFESGMSGSGIFPSSRGRNKEKALRIESYADFVCFSLLRW